MSLTAHDCAALDAADPLHATRAQFCLDDAEVYLDGNSLGVLPVATAPRLAEAAQAEWGRGLIRSWNTAGWIDQPQRVGNKIARLVGAAGGTLIAADSTSINLYKVLSAAALAQSTEPGRRVILSERANFPTDLYIAESVARQHGLTLVLLDSETIEAALASHLNANVAIVMLTHVNYRTGRMQDMAAVTRRVQAVGALMVWDLAHSAGAVPVDLTTADADFAVGCGYKYLNGGPGAPAFAWVNPRHAALPQPLSGWMGHAAPFAFDTAYAPAPGIDRYLCGTPSVLALAALECGVDTALSAEAHGGMQAIRAKSLALTSLFMQLMQARCATFDFTCVTPDNPAERGSHVSYTTTLDGYAIMQALIARGVIGDFRAPDILRFGFTPLYTRYIDVWRAVDALAAVMTQHEWREARFQQRAAVT
ncbi:kynureninase [Alcaligenaceae bacterium B3P038]|nr:kynureninase [Alcaligenaceae bacterium B3P038]